MSPDRSPAQHARSVLRRCARVSAICAGSLVTAAAVLVGMVLLAQRLEGENTRNQSQLAKTRAELDALRERLQLARGGGEPYAALASSGLIGPARREAWAQSLLDAVRSRGFVDAPQYTLLKPEPFQPASGPGALPGAEPPGLVGAAPADPSALPGLIGSAAAPDGSAGGPAGPIETLEHRLEFQLLGAHELDVLHILAQLQASHPGTVQGQRCELESPGPQGLKASCSARFLHVQRAGAGAGAAGDPARTDIGTGKDAAADPGAGTATAAGTARASTGASDAARVDAPAALGRLLLTPAERQAIDRMRRGEAASVQAAVVQAAPAQPQRLDGLITTRPGLRTAIINGTPVPGTHGASDGRGTPRAAGPGPLRVGEIRQGDETRDLVPEGSVVRGTSRRVLAPADGTPDMRTVTPAPGTGRAASP